MTTFRPLILIPAALLLVSACYDTRDKSDTTVDTTQESTVDTTVTSDSTETTDSGDAPSAEILVVIGVDSGPDRVETVDVGTWVLLTVESPDSDDEIHVHGVDLEQAVAAGESVTFTFLADTAGTIEVESHVTEGVLIVIEVV